jgi:hypothetical protein
LSLTQGLDGLFKQCSLAHSFEFNIPGWIGQDEMSYGGEGFSTFLPKTR